MGTPITERPRTAFVVTARHATQRAEFAKTAALFTRVNQQVLEHAQGVDEAEALPLTFTNASSECQRLLSLVLFAAGLPSASANTLSPAVDARFRASLGSFHLINAQDSALAAARAIRIVAAGSVDTTESMAARMAFLSQPLDQFLILNGLERGVPLVAGQRYKIVAE